MTLSSRLREARAFLGLKQDELAAKSGVSYGVYQKYEMGRTIPGGEALSGLVRLGISADWLLTGEGEMLTGERGKLMVAQTETGGVSLQFADSLEDFALIPRYAVEASMGGGCCVGSEEEIGRIAFRKDWLAREGLHAKHLAAITLVGDSMYPTLRDGSMALVDRSQNLIQSDGVYVLLLNNHLQAKRLQNDLSGGFWVRSDNPAYQPIHLHGEAAAAQKIVGRVIWAGGKL